MIKNIVLKECVNICNQNGALLKSLNKKDGRVTSALLEEEVINLLKKEETSNNIFTKYKVSIIEAPSRFWYDFKIKCINPVTLLEETYLVDAKASSGASPDNGSGASSLLYVFSSLSEEECKKGDRKNFTDLITKFYDLNQDKDYFYLVINKNDTTNNTYCSLINLHKDSLTSNPSNPPFQIKWEFPAKVVLRTKQDAFNLIVKDKYFKSHEKSYTKIINDHSNWQKILNL